MTNSEPREDRSAGGQAATLAATVVPLRDGADGIEVLMLQRGARGVFGGMWVFPGGQVDLADLEDPAETDLDDAAETEGPAGAKVAAVEPLATRGAESGELREVAAARRAAVREAREEASLELDPDTLVVHSWWLPPASFARRFATWFFLVAVQDAPEVVVDGAEIREHRWFTPADALRARDAGQLSLAPPTWMTLWQIGRHSTVAEALATSARRTLLRFQTRMYPLGENGLVATWQGDAAYEDGDLEALGPRRRLWMGEPPWRAEVDDSLG